MGWVFAYGSLMSDAMLRRYSSRPARLPGYHRAFQHASSRRWGRPDEPCPTLGLAKGGECWGVVFEIPPDEHGVVLRSVERREGASERRRETLAVETPDGTVDAWVWVSRSKRRDAREADPAWLEERLRSAHGTVGTGPEYVRSLVQALDLHGLRDPIVDALWERLRG
jgi:cation transport protein ChaC